MLSRIGRHYVAFEAAMTFLTMDEHAKGYFEQVIADAFARGHSPSKMLLRDLPVWRERGERWFPSYILGCTDCHRAAAYVKETRATTNSLTSSPCIPTLCRECSPELDSSCC